MNQSQVPISNGKSGPKQQQKPKEIQGFLPLTGADTITLRLIYARRGQKIMEERVVPKALMYAMLNPGESGMNPKESMRQISSFYFNDIGPELDSVNLVDTVSFSAANLSSLVARAYHTHSVIAAANAESQKNLLLQHPEVDRLLRLTAALLKGVSAQEIRKLSLDDTTVWVDRTVVELELNTKIKMKTQRLVCEHSSHREEKDVSVPDGATVEQVEKKRQQRLERFPQINDALEQVFGKIEELGAKSLDKEDRNTVVSYLNITYVERAEDRLPIIP